MGAAERRRQEWDHDGGWESSPSTDRPMERKPSCCADGASPCVAVGAPDDPGATQEVAEPSMEGSAHTERLLY